MPSLIKDYDSFNLAMFSWGDNWYLPNYLMTHGWKAIRIENRTDKDLFGFKFSKGQKTIYAYQDDEIDHFGFSAMEERLSRWSKFDKPLLLVVNEEKILYIANHLCEQGKLKKLSKICFETIRDK